MDSITQAALGAVVGEAGLGKKAGYRAALWGAALGTLPDLDILLNPFLDSVSELRWHRSFSHSVLFPLLFSPLIGRGLAHLHRQLEMSWYTWSKTVFLILFTHILIDIPTTYGTQVFYPFSNVPVTTDSMFIIDPLFTLPLLVTLVMASFFLRQRPVMRTRVLHTGLLAGALYIIWGIGIKTHVHSVFDASFQQQYGYYEKIKTTPNGPSTFLWKGYIVKEDTIYQSVYSVFDENDDLTFRAISRNTHRIEPYRDHRAFRVLLWFSRDFYTIETNNRGDMVFYDLRFGRSDLWLGTEAEEAEYVWGNRIRFDETGYAGSFDRFSPSFDTRSRIFSRFWNRIWGR